MRPLLSALSAFITVVFLLAGSIPSALAQDGSGIQQDPRAEWHDLGKGRKEFEISDAALLPARLALAAEQSECRYKERIQEFPVRFFSVEKRRLALVFCSGIAATDQLFDLTKMQKPKLIELPFLARKDGFGTTPTPGMMIWKKDTEMLEAVSRSDSCPSWMFRHSYRPGLTEGWVSGNTTFVVVRVEVSKNTCGREAKKWTTLWEATPWPDFKAIR